MNKTQDEKSQLQNVKQRMLYIFDRLNKGQALRKDELAVRFQVEKKTIQRDIADINDFYLTQYGNEVENTLDEENGKIVIYSAAKGGYVSRLRLRLSNDEIFALIKMLLENRTFDKAETSALCEHLLQMGTPDEKALIKKLVGGEKLRYEDEYLKGRRRRPVLFSLWELAQHINALDELEVKNRRQDGVERTHIVYPVGITFSEYYFYLIVYYRDEEEKGPRIFRVDRIQYTRPTGKHFEEKVIRNYKASDFEQKLQFMYSGEKIHLQFKFWGDSLDAVLDRLPNAEVIGHDGNKAIVKADAYSKGIKMWLLSQMEFLEVIEPQSFREEMVRTIQNMSKIYSKNL